MQSLLLGAGLLLPLALDTFAMAAALGAAGLTGRERARVTLVFTVFEAGMPIIGMVVGRAAGTYIGQWANLLGVAFLFIAGVLLLRPGRPDRDETQSLHLLAHARGIAILGLGLSISFDEMTIGLSAGLIGLPILATILWIAVQALVATQVGLRIGSRLAAAARERTESAAGIALILVALVLIVLHLHVI